MNTDDTKTSGSKSTIDLHVMCLISSSFVLQANTYFLFGVVLAEEVLTLYTFKSVRPNRKAAITA